MAERRRRPSYYLDSNAAFRLAADAPLRQVVVALASSQQIRLVLGWRLVWELAGAYDRKPEAIPDAQAEAAMLLGLPRRAVRFAPDGWEACCAASILPARSRAHYRALIHPTHPDYAEALRTLAVLARGDDRDAAVRWYRNAMPEAASYRAHEVAFRRRLISEAGGVRYRRDESLAHQMKTIEQRTPWMARLVHEAFCRLTDHRIRPIRHDLRWYGPLCIFARASVAFSILQVAGDPESGREKEKLSDLPDVSHIVASGLTARHFVTADRTAARVFRAAWHDRRLSCLRFPDQFRQHLNSL